MKKEIPWSAISGGIIIILQAFGVITADEGASLNTNIAAFLTSGIGLVAIIAAIIKRHKSGGTTEPSEEKKA